MPYSRITAFEVPEAGMRRLNRGYNKITIVLYFHVLVRKLSGKKDRRIIISFERLVSPEDPKYGPKFNPQNWK